MDTHNIFNIQGNMIDARQSHIQIINTPTTHSSSSEHETQLVKSLLPFFDADRERVIRFLDAVEGAEPVIVTTLVNRWVADGLILEELKGKSLWEVLNKHEVYKPTYQTWNSQIK